MGVGRTLPILLSVFACDEPGPSTCEATDPAVIAVPGGWTLATADQDPFPDRPDEPRCPEWGLRVEGGSLEVNTGDCSYATLTQATPAELPAGSRLTATVAHFDLFAPEPAMAHVALALGDTVLWSRDLPVPLAASVYPVEVVLTEPVPAGTPLLFHVHNHGANSWFLTRIEAAYPACPWYQAKAEQQNAARPRGAWR